LLTNHVSFSVSSVLQSQCPRCPCLPRRVGVANPMCVLVTVEPSHHMRGYHSLNIPRPCLRRLCALCASAVNYMFSAVCRLLKSLCALFRTPFLCFQ
jgi:hypothetical protein